ncbi:Ribonuclease E [Candidatus Entotheonellaceae bacterium PAL068K]
MKKKMLINVADEEESRVAIVEDGILEEFTIEVSTKEQIKGNIYNGVVIKVEPSLQAAFVDYGGKRHGFLPMGEIHENWYISDGCDRDRDKRPRIQDVLRRNQKILTQVTKEEMGNKGASLSTYISLPGRYLVFMPVSGSTGGISRKIEDEEERKKLKETVAQLNAPPNMGIIVRTAGLNRNKTELQRDLTYLQRLWTSVQEKSHQASAPALIYQEHDLVIRSIRDYFTPDIQEVLVDNREVYRRARDFFQAVMPRYQGRVQLYREKKPLFAKYQLEEQIEEIHSHKIDLKSGGSIVIDPTEALVAIDVNSGRATKEKGIEETAFKTNLEAAQEVARQLRLRDLGGLIVIDFIDMRNLKHIQDVEKALKQSVKRDKARTQVSRISQFGLLELSRQRLKPTILEGNYHTCLHCNGSGLVKSTISVALTILRRIRTEAAKENLAVVKAVLPQDAATYLLNQKRKEISRLEDEYDITIHLTGNAMIRQNEYEMGFTKREPLLEPPSASDKRRGKDSDDALSTAKTSRGKRSVTQNHEVSPTKPAIEVSKQALLGTPTPVPSEPNLPLAVARGRIFWRLIATSRRLKLAHLTHEAQNIATGTHSSRQTTGRFARRARAWWHRRNHVSQPHTKAPGKDASPRVSNNVG